MKAFVVLNEEEKPLEFCKNPWYEEGKELLYCLCIGDNFTAFYTKKDATASIRKTKKFIKGENLDWNISEWKVKEIEIPNLELR